MSSKWTLQVLKGTNLSQDAINSMTPHWGHQDEKSLYDQYKNYWENDIFFLIQTDSSILSMGRLRAVTCQLLRHKYQILGISDIRSIVPGLGYGKQLILGMKKYARQQHQTAIGFCTNYNVGFYKKCGLDILENTTSRFKYRLHSQEIQNPDDDPNVIYQEGIDGFIKKLIQNPLADISISMPHW